MPPDYYDWESEYYAGLDASSALSYAQSLGQDVGNLAGNALRNIGQGVTKFGSAIGSPDFSPLGGAASSWSPAAAIAKASTAADVTSATAEELRKTAAILNSRANASLDRFDRAVEEHERTVKTVRVVMIGVGVLAAAAVIYSIAK